MHMLEISNILLACYTIFVAAVKPPFVRRSRTLGRWCGAAPPHPEAVLPVVFVASFLLSVLLVLMNLASPSGSFWLLQRCLQAQVDAGGMAWEHSCLHWGASHSRKWCLPFNSIATPFPAPLLGDYEVQETSVPKICPGRGVCCSRWSAFQVWQRWHGGWVPTGSSSAWAASGGC